MMSDPTILESTGNVEFWVLPEKMTFISSPGVGARNIWEYYLHMCKEYSK